MLIDKEKNLKDTTTSFGVSDSTDQLFYRTERVSTALYMVTDCMSDREPIQHKLRELCVSLMSLVRSTALKNQFETHFITTEITHTIDEILSFLTMSATLGFISVMNYEILYKEFDKIKMVCIDRQKNTAILSLKSDFGGDRRTTNFTIPAETFLESFSLKNKPDFLSDSKGQQSPLEKHDVSDLKNKNDIHQEKSKSNFSTKSNNERNDKIVNFIKTKGQAVSITDIMNIVTDCSEKTVQRSLIALVNSGVLLRTGEKRWARYSVSNLK